MKKTIGILGGMGPLATADLYRMIVELTRADCDNDHIRVYIDSNAAIPDRTAAILRGGRDPVPEMLSALRNLEKCGADCVIMPCNTAHYFLPRLQKETELPILNMPAIAAARCCELFPGKRACILATKGTLESGVYARALEQEGVAFMTPEEAERDELMRLIYDVVAARGAARERGGLFYPRLHRAADPFARACRPRPLRRSDAGAGESGDPLLRLRGQGTGLIRLFITLAI